MIELNLHFHEHNGTFISPELLDKLDNTMGISYDSLTDTRITTISKADGAAGTHEIIRLPSGPLFVSQQPIGLLFKVSNVSDCGTCSITAPIHVEQFEIDGIVGKGPHSLAVLKHQEPEVLASEVLMIGLEFADEIAIFNPHSRVIEHK